MKGTTFYRVTDGGKMKPQFSKPGDVIAVHERYDTDSVDNLTTGQNYTYGGEQGTKIEDIDNFPLYEREQENLKRIRGY